MAGDAKFWSSLPFYMSTLASILHVALLIFVVVMIFNVIIFIHELGHFLAGKWRGLQIDRFQIWFGRPIWSKTINGVQYGLGWIPAGGFVALPQMAPMEAIEGGGTAGAALPPVTPLDKIIVALAGPLFSLLLALLSAVVVWQVGKPNDFVPTQVIGTVMADSPAQKAGLLAGDKIIEVNGKTVRGYAGTLESISENIILSEGNEIEFTVERPGQTAPLKLVSKFEIPEKNHWFQRSGLRRVGILPQGERIAILSVSKDSPASRAGLQAGDTLVAMDGEKFPNASVAYDYIKQAGLKSIDLAIERGAGNLSLRVTPLVPVSPAGKGPMIGVSLDDVQFVDEAIVYPKPLQQVSDSLTMMWTTISRLVSRGSNIGIDHLSGPIGIAKHQYAILQSEHAWQRLLAFMVLFNVNLAVLNMLPLPVLDGGHITLAILEKIARRPVKARVLEVVQTAFALLLMGLMLYVSTKDVGDGFGRGSSQTEKLVFPQ
ncbi:MAG: RIP metalloprotease RseP [Verrucomicrobia bacterium]|nr:MAG: RIP metalloprotease RseP [Verrucomicrobiota bacterium]